MTDFSACEKCFVKTELDFLKSINDKKNNIVQKNKRMNLKRAKIIEQIKQAKKCNSVKENLDYINCAEMVLESINEIILNYMNLSYKLHNLENAVIILNEKQKLNIDNNIDSDVADLRQKLNEIKDYEIKIEDENRKYEMIIENYFSDSETSNISNESEEYKEENIEILKDNLVLKISEQKNKVFLPYAKNEVENFLEKYPDEYKTPKDVIQKEFITSFDIYNKRPSIARFREGYYLYRNKDMMSVIDSLKFAFQIMFREDLNPAIIAAVKNRKQLEDYIECLEKDDLEKFTYFKIIFEVNPLKTKFI